eukprot:s3363_g8.t1
MRLHLGLCSVLSIVSAVRKGDFRASSQQSHLEEIHGHANQTAACCCCKREVVETGWLFKSKQKTSEKPAPATKQSLSGETKSHDTAPLSDARHWSSRGAMENATPYDFSGSSCSREATQVRFMYFSPEDRVSECHVSTAVNDVSTFDEWGASALVVMHIQLAAPLFNPFMMNNLLQLLRQTCQKCHKFKCREAWQNQTKPGLLSEISPDPADIVFRVEEITRDGTTATREVRKAQDLKQTKQAAEKLDAATAAARAGQSKGAHGPQVSSSLEAIRQAGLPMNQTGVIRDFNTNLPASCARCQAHAKWRREGFEAMFVTQKGGKDGFADAPFASQEQLAIPEYTRDLLRNLWKNEARALRPGAGAIDDLSSRHVLRNTSCIYARLRFTWHGCKVQADKYFLGR